jgi:xanthine dehydrogenase YagS FAD-binding subunit
MNPFDYQRASSTEDAIKSIDGRVAKFLGGGTNLIDLMKLDVEHPATLVDITGLDLTKVEPAANSGLLIGGLEPVMNFELRC